MKLLIIFGICLAVFIQPSFQLPTKINDRKVLPLPGREDKNLKDFGKIDIQKPKEIIEIKPDEIGKDEIGVELNEKADVNAEVDAEREKRFIGIIAKIAVRVIPKTWPRKDNKNRRDIIFVDEEIHTFDDSNALTDDEIVDLAILDAATNILYDQYQGSDILDTEDMTEFSKREKRWSLRRSFKKRIHEAVGALFG